LVTESRFRAFSQSQTSQSRKRGCIAKMTYISERCLGIVYATEAIPRGLHVAHSRHLG
jgi:hypothetical protein